MVDVDTDERISTVVYTVIDSRDPDLEAARCVIGEFAEQVAHGGGELVMILTERRLWTHGVPMPAHEGAAVAEATGLGDWGEAR